MSSISIQAAQATYGGETERDVIVNMVAATGVKLIYRYRNAYQPWWRWLPTDYFRVERPSDEDRLWRSPDVRSPVLVYDHGTVTLPVRWAGLIFWVELTISLVLTFFATRQWEVEKGSANPDLEAITLTIGIQIPLAVLGGGLAWLSSRFVFKARPGAGLLIYGAVALLVSLVLLII